MSNMNNTDKILEMSKVQLDREGMVLTKKDLIAIIVALEPSYITKINEINNNTVADLNTIICVIIYDPSRYSDVSIEKTHNNKKPTATTNFLKLKW